MCIGRHLSVSYKNCIFWRIARKFRYWLCKHFFEYCGEGVNIEKGAVFGKGDKIRIGNNSGIGINADIPNGSIIGNDVMMGPNCKVYSINHVYERTDIPMRRQGMTKPKPIIIEDDVWIGGDVTFTVGRHVSKGTVVAANSVVTRDFPPYSIIGGNPAKLIRSRLENNNE